MNIGIPVAQFHPGNTGEYAQRALISLGHTAVILSIREFLAALRRNEFDYFFCVDSPLPMPLGDASFSTCSLERVGFWFIDFRHNKDRPNRIPSDHDNAHLIHTRGGWIFQSQIEDADYCRNLGWTRVSWLPLAADPDIWSSEPMAAKEFDIGFVGNIWDIQRKTALDLLLCTESLRVGFLGKGAAWKEEAAALMRKCRIGFNINSFFGQPIAYDINMRAFETLSCGVPLFTNEVPSLYRVFPENASFIRTYNDLTEMLPLLLKALRDEPFIQSGREARQWILDHATYAHRMKAVADRIQSCLDAL